jgi:outer membrane protein TolC
VLVSGALALVLSLLPACAGPQLSARHRDLARSFEASAPRPASDAERDPLAGLSVLSTQALVRAVIERNPSLASARHAWRAALARYPQETSLDDPMLGGAVAPASFGSPVVDPGYSVELAQKLPFPGKLPLRGEIALAEAEAAAGDFEAVRLRLATLAVLLRDDLALLDSSLDINAEHVLLLEEYLRIASARYEVGAAPQQAPLQAEVELAHLQHRDVVLRSSRRIAAEQINVLLHRESGRGLPPLADEPEPPAARQREELLARALASHPELRAARARARARAAAVALARRDYFPDVTLVGGQDAIMPEKDLQPFVGLELELPLALGRRRAALDEARARLAGAESDAAGVEDELRFAVESALAREHEARHVLSLYQSRLLPAASDQVEAARASFETGESSFLSLIDAERNLRAVRLGREEARRELSRSHAELRRAIGEIPGLP